MCKLYTSMFLTNTLGISDNFQPAFAKTEDKLPIGMAGLVIVGSLEFTDRQKAVQVSIKKYLIAIRVRFDNCSAFSLKCRRCADNLGRSKKFPGVFAAKYKNLTSMTLISFLNGINEIFEPIHDMRLYCAHLSLSGSKFQFSRFCRNSKSVTGAALDKVNLTLDVDQVSVNGRFLAGSMIGGQQ